MTLNVTAEATSTTAPTDRLRRGGRAGKRNGSAGHFEQQPFRQLTNPFVPTAYVSADEVEAIHEASLTVLEEIGIDFLHEGAGRSSRPPARRSIREPIGCGSTAGSS